MIKGKWFKNLIVLFGCTLVLAGCESEEEELPIIMVDSTETEVSLNMSEISIGNVMLTKKVSCNYVQTEDQQVSFETGGKVVDKVYVRVGDYVEEGDLLLTLENGDIKEQMAQLEYQISRNTLLKGYLDKAEAFAKQSEEYTYVYEYYSPESEEEINKHNHKLYLIEQDYNYQRDDYDSDILYDNRKLAKLKNEYNESRVYATLSGKVADIKADLEGSVARKDDVIMSIVDNDSGLFEIEDSETAKYFTEGQSIPMTIIYGMAKGEYELTPYHMDEWGQVQQFEVISAPDSASLEVGVSGTIVATIDKRENVTRIPNRALYEADGKYYTYVLNDDNMKEARFIEIGLQGDDFTEVTGGIEAGTKVVSR